MTPRSLERCPVHLGRGGAVEAQPMIPQNDGAMEWYIDYASRHAADGAEGRLVSMYRFAEDWPSWQMHPHGAEVVLCTAGCMTLHQEHPGGRRESLILGPGEYAINPPGVWHTADIDGEATGVFITPGAGTQHRPR